MSKDKTKSTDNNNKNESSEKTEEKESFSIGDVVAFQDDEGKIQKGKVKLINPEEGLALVVVGDDEYDTEIKTLTKITPEIVPPKNTDGKIFKTIFRENRCHEIFISGEKIIWDPNGVNPIYPEKYKKGLPEAIINNKDFQSQKSYFTIVELK